VSYKTQETDNSMGWTLVPLRQPQAICAEGADYTKKSVETRLALVEKLLGAKSLETVIQIQSEYANKAAYADFVAQATKMGELHSNLAKAAFKPAEQAIAAMQGTKR
jgi:hypothetical protein